MGRDLKKLRELYESCTETFVRWSESDVLPAEYLHLHEEDIGQLSGYQLWGYPRTFVESLGKLRRHLKKIVFCYSLESKESASHPPENCEKEYFFWYRLEAPAQNPLTERDFIHPDGDIKTRMFNPARVKTDLGVHLAGCQWVQLYMLRSIDGAVKADCRLVEYSESLIHELAENHAGHGSYQFSIYGYEFEPEYRLEDAQQIFMKVAFLTHVWTWNHDLRTIHKIRDLLHDELQAGEKHWSETEQRVRSVFIKLGRLRLGSREIIPLPQKFWKARGNDSLFKEIHEIDDWTGKRFMTFLQSVHQRKEARQLIEFVRLCGWAGSDVKEPGTKNELTHARGMWLATKLLTREALDPDAKKVSFDQLVLSILFALDRVPGLSISINVSRTLKHPQLFNLSQDDRLQHLLLSHSEMPHLAWLDHTWKDLTEDSHDNSKYQIAWSYTLGDAGPALAAYVKSGMLAIPGGNLTDPQILQLPLGAPASEFLRSIFDVVESLARQHSRGYPGWVKPVTVSAEEITVATPDELGMAATVMVRVSIIFDGILPVHQLSPNGELLSPLVELAGYFDHRTILHFDAMPSNSGLFMVSRAGRSQIVLNFQGVR